MIEMEWNPYQNDHEDANGQFEMNWDYDDCLITACLLYTSDAADE